MAKWSSVHVTKFTLEARNWCGYKKKKRHWRKEQIGDLVRERSEKRESKSIGRKSNRPA